MAVGVVFIARTGGKQESGEDGGLGAKLLYPFIIVAGMLMAVGVVWNAQLREGAGKSVARRHRVLRAGGVRLRLHLFAAADAAAATRGPGRGEVVDAARGPHGRGRRSSPACCSSTRLGRGAFNGLLITANLLTSVALDHFGWLGMKQVRPERPVSSARRSWSRESCSSRCSERFGPAPRRGHRRPRCSSDDGRLGAVAGRLGARAEPCARSNTNRPRARMPLLPRSCDVPRPISSKLMASCAMSLRFNSSIRSARAGITTPRLNYDYMKRLRLKVDPFSSIRLA